MWYITANKVPQHFSNPPGYVPVAMNVQLARGAQNVVSAFGTKQSTVDGAIEAGTMFAGTPDQVLAPDQETLAPCRRLRQSADHGAGRFLEHDDTVHGIRMFAREVYPRLKELYPDTTVSGMTEPVAVAAS